MSDIIGKGSRVTVRSQGDGVVFRISKPHYYVQLDRGQQTICSFYELELIEEPVRLFQDLPQIRRQRPGAKRRGPLLRPVAADDGARRSVEALRFGLVPDDALEEVTLDYDDWADWINRRLPEEHQDGPTVSEVIGAYGTGKSHAMALVRQIARQQDYLTARVEVDGKSITLADPEPFLYSLWSSLRSPDGQPTDLIDQYLSAIRNSGYTPRVAPRGKDRIARNYEIVQQLLRNGRLADCRYAVNAVLSSSPEFTAAAVKEILYKDGYLSSPHTDIFRMVGMKVGERPYDFLESLIGHTLIAKYAGWKGLVVTVDEFEVERACLDPKMLSRAEDLFNLLKSYLLGNLKHPDVPLGLFFATASKGTRGDRLVDELIGDCDGGYKRLRPLSSDGFQKLAERIFSLYSRAYGFNTPFLQDCFERAFKSVQSHENLTREFIRRYIFVLDSTYGPPNAHEQ